MIFTWLNKQGVQSDAGFIVQRTGRFSVEYREGDRAIEIIIESGMSKGKPSISFRRSDFSKWSSSKSEQESVISNFEAACIFKGVVPNAI